MSQNINKNILKIVAQKTSAWNNQYQSYITYYNDTKNSYENNRAAWLAVKKLDWTVFGVFGTVGSRYLAIQ
jgi:hypothetical protein